MSDNAFALDLQEKYTRMCDSRVAGDKVEPIALGVKESAPTFYSAENQQIVEKQAEVITQLYNSLKIKKKMVNVIIPDSYCYSQIVEMPTLKEKELLSAIRYQSDEFIPMPIEETNLDIEILREDLKNKKILVLIAAAPKKIIAQIEKTIDLAGLIPGSLESELTAVGRLFNEKVKSPGATGGTLILNLGYMGSSLYILDNASSLIVFTRSFKVGLDLFLKDMKVNLNVDDKKGIEILKSIGFAKDGSYNTEAVLGSVLKEIENEIEKCNVIAKERFNLPISQIVTFNYDNHILHFNQKITERFSLPSSSLTLSNVIAANPVTQSFSADMSSLISVIAGAL